MLRRAIIFSIVSCSLLLASAGCAAPRTAAKPAPAKHTAGQGITRLGFSIQVGAFKEVRNAERLTTRLQEKGIEAFYFRKDDGLYAVRFGDFPARGEAQRTAQKLVNDRLIGAYFIAPPRTATLQKGTGPELRQGGEPVRPAKPAGDMGAIAARTAERFVGIPYRWGGNNVVEGLDCSGFVRAVYNLCGVNIPRTSREQFQVGQPVERDELQDGDLVFFGPAGEAINHVGIYVGAGRFVHAPRRGDDIKISSLDEEYFAKRYVGAKRYV